MFQFPRLPPCTLFRSGAGARALPRAGSPIRASPDRRPFAPPRGLSQLAAPFIGFLCQGIRRAPLTSSLRKTPSGMHYIVDLNLVRSVDLEESHRFANREELRIRLNLVFSLSLCSCQGARRAARPGSGPSHPTGPWKPDAAVGGEDSDAFQLPFSNVRLEFSRFSLERR